MRRPSRACRSSLTHLRLNPSYVQARQRIRHILRELPGVGGLAYSGVHGLTSALREFVTPHTFFEALGIRYAGPIDGHDIVGVEQALTHAAEWPGPIVVHMLTQKGRGYAPAEEDDVQRLHDFKVLPTTTGIEDTTELPATTYTHAFTRALIRRRGDRSPDRGNHRGNARAHRPPALRAALPRALLRRGHRRAARA